MTICYPPGTDWSCKFTDAKLLELRNNPDTATSIEKAEAFAWSTLAALTLYRIGTCPITVHPCAAASVPSGGYLVAPVGRGANALPVVPIGRLSPFISGGVWYNACGCSPTSCGCDSLPSVPLPGPVGAIVEVLVDGSPLPVEAYRVVDGYQLVRTDGEAWPARSDDDFAVTYYRGVAPNIMTRAAAGALAAEFYAACNGDPCRLPGNVTSVVRGGESYELEPTSFDDGFTGIAEVDAVIRIYNPNHLKVAPAVASPDAYRQKVTTWRG